MELGVEVVVINMSFVEEAEEIVGDVVANNVAVVESRWLVDDVVVQ